MSSLFSSIISEITGQAAFVITSDATGLPIWKNAKIVSVEINSTSDNTDHPVSTNELSGPITFALLAPADYNSIKILKPSHLRLTVICPDLSTIESILTNYADTQFTCSITTKSVIIKSMCIATVEIEQTPQMLSATRVTMILEQVLLSEAAAAGFLPSQDADASMYGVLVQTPTPITQTVSGLYTKVSQYVSGLL
jgi:hypothetical protein